MNQSHKKLEIILIDDESTDGSGFIYDNYKKLDSRIVVIHKQNGGLVSARKAGLDVSNGDYIGFVDGDDYIDEIIEMLRRLGISEKNNLGNTGKQFYVNIKGDKFYA